MGIRITTIEQLIQNLNMGPGHLGYEEWVASIEIPISELLTIIGSHEKGHLRICLYDTPEIEAILTHWKPGESTDIHDYNDQQAWTKVLGGQLVLECFDISSAPSASVTETKLIDEGEMIYLNDSFGFHRFSNLGTEDAFAIHIYADKIKAWHMYDEDTGEVTTQATYCHHSLLDEPS